MTFCTGGSIVNAKRSKLDPHNVNMIASLRENMEKVQLDCITVKDPMEDEEIKILNL
jgi:hypothetical protein